MQIDTTIPEFEIIVSNEPVNQDIKSDDAVFEAPVEDVEIIADTNDELVEPTAVETPFVERNYSDNADPAAITVYEQLLEKGYVDESEEFDGTWDKLDSSLEYLPQKVLNSLVANTSDVSKDVIRFVFSSDNITADEILNFVKVNYEESQVQNTEIETMDEARAYLERLYAERGVKPIVAQASISALEEGDLLMEEAKEEYEKTLANQKPKTEALIQARTGIYG